MAYKVTFSKDNKGNVSVKEEGNLFATAHEVHHTIARHCDYCGAEMTPSDVNDYGSLCERCYMNEYYGEN